MSPGIARKALGLLSRSSQAATTDALWSGRFQTKYEEQRDEQEVFEAKTVLGSVEESAKAFNITSGCVDDAAGS